MNKFLYFLLASNNLKKNKNTYIPYIIAGIGIVVTFLLLVSISENEGLKAMRGADVLSQILALGSYVVAIFAIFFLMYANGFLFKKRKKELGLYSILGLERKHVIRVLFHETMITATISILGGIIISLIFGKLCFLLLLNIMRAPKIVPFSLKIQPLIKTLIFFGILYFVIFLGNSIRVRFTNVITLLHSEELGEKEPKTSVIRAVFGIICLFGGYYIAVSVKSPLSAIFLFFVAVILVIFGTFSLFSAGSIAILKILKKNKGIYYKSKNFIAISGMIYRMKQNAKGLSNICILSTMVIVMISGTTALYFGQEDTLRNVYPFDVNITSDKAVDIEEIGLKIHPLIEENHLEITEGYQYRDITFVANIENNTIIPTSFANVTSFSDMDDFIEIHLMTQEQLNQLKEGSISLREGEAALLCVSDHFDYDTVVVDSTKLQIVKNLESVGVAEKKKYSNDHTMYLIVNDEKVIDEIVSSIKQNENAMDSLNEEYKYNFNTNGTKSDRLALANALTLITEQNDINIQCLESNRDDWYSTFGGLLFLGVFLGIIFMMATVLIIYFKQISEGFQDRDRFIIMQKVGMSQEEVRGTIRKQILMVFFLPLIMTFIHIAFAFPIIGRMLLVFGLTNNHITLLCTLGCVGIFAIFYIIVYSMTAKVYYKLVER